MDWLSLPSQISKSCSERLAIKATDTHNRGRMESNFSSYIYECQPEAMKHNAYITFDLCILVLLCFPLASNIFTAVVLCRPRIRNIFAFFGTQMMVQRSSPVLPFKSLFSLNSFSLIVILSPSI